MGVIPWEFESPSLHFKIKIAEIAQLVEHDLAKVGVASSSLVFRSFFLPLGKRGSKQPRDVKRSFADRKSVAQYVGVIERLAASHEKY